MQHFVRLLRTRIAQGTAMGFYGLVVQLGIQLISVPILTAHWGIAGYGVWVMLFTVPTVLAMADFGLTAAGANAMTAAAARGETDRAAQIHAALRTITALAGLTILALAVAMLFSLDAATLDLGQHWPPAELRGAALLLCGYGVLALINGVALAGFRAGDAFAYSGWLYQTMILAEAVAALATALLGGGPQAVALAYFLARLGGSLVLALGARRKVPWLAGSALLASPGELRPLLRPALAAMLLPGGNALALQGAVMVIGVIGGPAAVPAYSVVRTLSRTALQFALRFNIAAMPRYTVFIARGEQSAADRLVAINLAFTALLVVPAALLLVLLGGPFVRLWTGGAVDPGLGLLVIMALTMLGNAAWVPLSNLLLAVNRHGRFTYVFVLVAAMGLGLGTALTAWSGMLGMALAMLLLELAMTIWVWHIARADGLTKPGTLARGFSVLLQELQPGAGRGNPSAP